MVRGMERMKVLGFNLPPGCDYDQFIKMMKANGVHVDDMCAVSSRGRVFNLWIPVEDLDDKLITERAGRFATDESVEHVEGGELPR